MLDRPIILCFFDYFYPAFKSGGPARSSLGLVEHLSNYYEILVITRDRDRHDEDSMAGIHPNSWNRVKGVHVFYLAMNRYWKILNAIKEGSAMVYYFNSFFSFWFTIVPLAFVTLTRKPKQIVVAPRGEFSPGAYNLKGLKKRLFVRFFGRLYSGATFHASSESERADILNVLPLANVRIALNLRPKSEFIDLHYKPSAKKKDVIRLVFLSRIDRKKNLLFALDQIKNCKSTVELDIYGIIDDLEYWTSCQPMIAELNNEKNIKVQYRGEASSTKSIEIISGFDLMLFTSLGENFSHSVLESFMAARPALISNTTYWRNLQPLNAGWDFPLNQPYLFSEKIDELAKLDAVDYDLYCRGAYKLAFDYFNNPSHVADYKLLFD